MELGPVQEHDDGDRIAAGRQHQSTLQSDALGLELGVTNLERHPLSSRPADRDFAVATVTEAHLRPGAVGPADRVPPAGAIRRQLACPPIQRPPTEAAIRRAHLHDLAVGQAVGSDVAGANPLASAAPGRLSASSARPRRTAAHNGLELKRVVTPAPRLVLRQSGGDSVHAPGSPGRCSRTSGVELMVDFLVGVRGRPIR